MVNKTCPLVISTAFEYDFSSCHYDILESIGWDLGNIQRGDKLKRNIAIGMEKRKYQDMSRYLESATSDMIDFYLTNNVIEKNNIILRQKDGIITNKYIEMTDLTKELKFIGPISRLIFSTDKRKWLILYSNGRYNVKGFGKRFYDKSFYNLFWKLNYSSPRALCRGIDNMRREICYNGKKSWHVFYLDSDGKPSIPLKNRGFIKTNQSALSSIQDEDIDKNYLWDEYVWCFAESVLYTFSRERTRYHGLR
jgi:hypothetical protein